MKKIVFTLCSNNYLAHAKSLGDSVIATNPQYKFVIGLVDKRDPGIDYGFFNPHEIIDFDTIGFPVFTEMIKRYNVIEFNTSVKPFYIEFLLNQYGSGSKVFYIDPDILVYHSLDHIADLLEANSIVLTPMLTQPLPTVTTDELVALRHGIYNLGFIAVKHSPETFRLVSWWQERLKEHCVINKALGLFTDQKWIDLAPLFFSEILILKDPGYNVAWWNFSERKLLTQNGKYFVNNLKHPLVFFHFSGYKVGSDYYTGRVQKEAYSLKARPDLQEIFKDYLIRLIANQFQRLEKHKPLLNFVPLKKKPTGAVNKAKSKIKAIIKKALR